jgi:hypothetical protein
MAKLINRYRLGNKLLKIFDGKGYLRGVLYEFKWDTSVSPNKCHLEKVSSANFYEKDGDMDEYRVREYFGMLSGRKVTTDSYIDFNHRVIWTNNDYSEWETCMLTDYPDEEARKEEGIEITYERYMEDCDNYLYDERDNLDITIDGVIIAFADLGLWDGRHNGAKTFGNNVKNILYSNNDYQDWYCDRYNVRCTDIHHDGTNYYLYRVAKDEETANRLVNKIAYENMTVEEFMRATKSLRKYVAGIYGW